MTETALSRQALYSARPTLRLAGQADVRLSNLLVAMRMDESEGGMSRLELRLSNLVGTTAGGTEAAFGAGSDLKLGAELAVYTGDVQAPVEVFRGKVSAIELLFSMGGAPEITVLAEDALQAARLARRSKVYTDMSPADVVREVAGALNLSPTVTGLTSPVDTWAQINESDLSFLRRLLARFDADLQIVGDALQVAPRGDVARGEVELALFGQLVRARVIADLSQQVTATSAAGWNPVDGSAVNHEATQITQSGPGSGRSGLSWLDEAFGCAAGTHRPPRGEQRRGGPGRGHRGAGPARAPLRAHRGFERRQPRHPRGHHGVHHGPVAAVRQPLLRVRRLAPVRPDGGLPHRVQWRVRIPGRRRMKRDGLFDRPAAWLQAGALAQVVSLDDPEGRNRVQVRLLAHDGVGDQDAPLWARVVAPFAGNDRGFFFLPDVDDEVLVIFMNGDARHPLIIGGLWNGNSPSPADLANGQHRTKRLKSKNGVAITILDEDGQETLTLETPGGQTVTLQDGPGTITLEDANGNQVVMEAAGISVTAAAKVKVTAAQVEVSAGMVKVDAAIADFSGIVKCAVLQTNAVISTSYTPGAGNVW